MEGLLQLNQKDGAVVTMVEMTDSNIEQARKSGWSLTGIFEGARRDRYGEKDTSSTMFGVYVLPCDEVVINAVSRAEKAEKGEAEAKTKLWEAQEAMKRAVRSEFEARAEMMQMQEKAAAGQSCKVPND